MRLKFRTSGVIYKASHTCSTHKLVVIIWFFKFCSARPRERGFRKKYTLFRRAAQVTGSAHIVGRGALFNVTTNCRISYVTLAAAAKNFLTLFEFAS